MKARYLALCLLACCLNVHAQSLEEFKKQAQAEYSSFKKQAAEEYKNFRDKANAEYAEFMSKAWEPFKQEAPIEKPVLPEPPVAPVAPPVPQKDRKVVQLPLEEVIPIDVPIVQPKPAEPIPVPATVPVYDAFGFTFYGTRCNVGLDNRLKFHLEATDEQHVAAAWETLSKESYNRLVNECLELREKMNLCGWGYYAMLRAMSDAFLGKNSNESVLLQMFLLTQSGYAVRIARCDNSLCLLMPSDYTIFSKPYLTIDNEKYYVFSNDTGHKTFHVFNHSFPKEQVLSIRMEGVPTLKAEKTRERTLASKRYPELKVNAPLDQNLIDFFNDYPLNDNWTLYSLTSLSQATKDALYPVLKNAIKGKSETEAANMLINFVQTAFEYKTDQEQFGRERPLFGDETLYYPYSDCEDRSILYSILTRDLLGLDVVFLYYPGEHLATAVHFNSEVNGDYLMVDGVKYIVCDPTYIGAEIGRAMPKLNASNIKVVRIK